jgi:hypothetical protein
VQACDPLLGCSWKRGLRAAKEEYPCLPRCVKLTITKAQIPQFIHSAHGVNHKAHEVIGILPL